MFEILKTTRTGRQMLRNATKTLGSASAVAALLGIACGLGMAQSAGSLDPTFGAGGVVTTTLGGSLSTLTAIEQSSGDIAVVTGFNNVGDHVNPNEEVVGLARYTSDGTPIGTTTAAWFISREGPTAKSWMLARLIAAGLAQRLVQPAGPLSPWGYELRFRPRSESSHA